MPKATKINIGRKLTLLNKINCLGEFLCLTHRFENALLPSNSELNMRSVVPRDPYIEFRERLKCELRIQGSSFARISEELGVSQTAVSYVARRRNRSETIETAIANALGQTVEEVFSGIDRQVQEGGMT